jgi:hypothetical protein
LNWTANHRNPQFRSPKGELLAPLRNQTCGNQQQHRFDLPLQGEDSQSRYGLNGLTEAHVISQQQGVAVHQRLDSLELIIKYAVGPFERTRGAKEDVCRGLQEEGEPLCKGNLFGS